MGIRLLCSIRWTALDKVSLLSFEGVDMLTKEGL